jgi:mycoredoxin
VLRLALGNEVAALRAVCDEPLVNSREETYMAITMYGTSTCSDCKRSKALLDSLSVTYDWIDLETTDGAPETAVSISGRMSTPLIVFPDGTHQVEPTDADLRSKLDELGLVSR